MSTQLDNFDPEVSDDDIILMINIINTVSKRGAFQPDEFQVVGELFNKLKTIISEPDDDQLKLNL